MNYANIDRKRRLIIDESKATLAEWLYCYGDVLAGQPKLLKQIGAKHPEVIARVLEFKYMQQSPRRFTDNLSVKRAAVQQAA
jgi:hypothetical protein